jgi:Dolichyl-phosphate-mannose-protein mannosyltransferase
MTQKEEYANTRIGESMERTLSKLGLAIPAALFVLALFSRLYDLSNLPFFQPGWPTCGGLPDCAGPFPNLPGLYSDEVTNVLATHSLSSIISNFGGGPIQSLLIFISTLSLGASNFAVRLPFALISSVTPIFVYLTTKTIAGSRISAVLSALYFIVMVPAVIYGRMAFGENLIALLFIINIYSTIKIGKSLDHESSKPWFLLASLSAALGTIVKLDGIIIIVYFIVFLFKERMLGRSIPYLALALGLGVVLPLGLIQVVTGRAYSLVVTGVYPFIAEMGNQLAMFHFFVLDTLPSGIPLYWGNYFIPEFWYLFLYFALIALMIYNYKEYFDLLLALGVFVAFFATFSAPFGSYWMIIIQPLLAIAFGPGLKRLLQMPLVVAFVFYAFLFVPLATSLGEALIIPSEMGKVVITNNTLFIWNLCIALPLAALLFFTVRNHTISSRWRTWVNGTLLFAFFVALIVSSFLIPDLYPYYFGRFI